MRDAHYEKVLLVPREVVRCYVVVVELPTLGVEVKDILLHSNHDLPGHFKHLVLVPTEGVEHLV